MCDCRMAEALGLISTERSQAAWTRAGESGKRRLLWAKHPIMGSAPRGADGGDRVGRHRHSGLYDWRLRECDFGTRNGSLAAEVKGDRLDYWTLVEVRDVVHVRNAAAAVPPFDRGSPRGRRARRRRSGRAANMLHRSSLPPTATAKATVPVGGPGATQALELGNLAGIAADRRPGVIRRGGARVRSGCRLPRPARRLP